VEEYLNTMAKFYTEVTDLNQNVVINTETKEEANFLEVMNVVSYGLQAILEYYDEYIYQPKTESLPQIYYCRKDTKVDYLALAVDLIKEYMITNVAEFQFVNKILYSDMSIGSTVDLTKTPIAIQVAPSSHFQDKKARWMSLVNMSLTDPDNGTTAIGNDVNTNPGAGINWGYEGVSGTESEGVASLKFNEDGETLLGFLPELRSDQGTQGFLPNKRSKDIAIDDKSEYFIDPLDNRYYYTGLGSFKVGSTISAMPSPFYKNGRLNPWSRLYALNHENGYELTYLMINAQTVPWQDVSIIDNESKEGNYPAAVVCKRFNPFGGQGYLPSMCELQYLAINLENYNELLADIPNSVRLGDYYLEDPQHQEGLGSWLWSSSEYNSDFSWTLDTFSLRVHSIDMSDGNNYSRVRAFLAY
jgi:hypothetical protein